MTCDVTRGPDGSVLFMCGRNERAPKCDVCKKRKATKLCDFPLRGAKAGQACDRNLCDSCAVQVGDPVLRPVAPGSTLISSARRAVRRRTGRDPDPPLLSAVEDTVDYCPAHADLAKRERPGDER